jgi:outer membrane receptor protein involved in Fe transport
LAIERVETITGGASATYGADAVGGVVNFIMKRNFQGLQFDAQMGQTERGDAFEYQVGGLMGANLNDNKGNVMFAFATNKRQSAKRIDRPWFTDAMKDPTIGGDEFFPDFSGYDPIVPIGSNNSLWPSQAVLNGIFSQAPPCSISSGDGTCGFPATRLYFNPDGTAFTGFFQSFSPAGTYRFQGDLTGTKWKKTRDGLLAQNFQDALAVLPLQRDNMLVRGNYEINDWLGFFAQGMFSKVETRTVQQPSPSVNGWAAFIPNDGRAIPAELAALLNSRVVDPTAAPGTTGPTAPWRLTYYLNFANRETRVDVMTYNLLAGFEGKIPNTDWTWELYGSKGESETSSVTTGVASLERFRAVVSAPNWGAGFNSLDAGYSNPAFAGFGASFATCTSGINPFDKATPISKDCIEAISADLKTRASMQQDIWEANAQGKVVDMPAGELRAAVGATYRQNRYEFLNDTITTQGRSFNDQALGIYPSGNAGGQITVNEFYGELLVPLLKDLRFAKKLELELGARSSHYDTTGTSTTWKAMGNWETNNSLRFRGGYNRAERSPNIGELYLAPSQTFQIGASGDLCSLANPSPYSANPANANGAQSRALCEQLMEKAAPGTAANFYANPAFANAVGITFAFPSVHGNPNLTPEKADTYTIGAVFDSPWQAEMARELRVSIDYYHIEVDDAIGPQSVDIAQRQCFDPSFNPTYDVNSQYCLGINRVANDGALGNIQLTYLNNGRFKTDGIDTQIDWAFRLGPGKFSLNSVFTYLLSLKSAELSGDPLVDFAGTLGPTQNELNPGSYDWKMFNTFSYNISQWTASLQWQHFPSIKSATAAYVPDTFTKDAVIRFGIDNLFDKAPPLLNRNTDPNLPPYLLPGGNFGGTDASNPALYDFIGRVFWLGATLKL